MSSPKNLNDEKLVQQSNKPKEDSMKLHPFYRGKTEVVPKCCIRDINDFAIWYTPGVAEPCMAINRDPKLAYEFTNKWNTIAVVSDGTRVLGLGNIGPLAAIPVMEGKALIFKYLGGVDAVPICLGTEDKELFIQTVKLLQPSFGGFNLEDISQPKCFDILYRLRNECTVPVWHDDQQGTALVTLAGLINALKVVGKKMSDVKITLIGAGSANVCIARLLMFYGANAGKMMVCDSKGILNRKRADIKGRYPEKWELCEKTNKENVSGSIADAMAGTDVVISLSTPGPDVIKPEWVEKMSKDAILFACANPTPEIWPWVAKEAGARVVATGRSDFPNQVNNSLGFPAVFRGVLDVQAQYITDEMCITAAEGLARYAEKSGISENRLLPTMDEWEVIPIVATDVGMKAIEQKVAMKTLTRDALYKTAYDIIARARKETQLLMSSGIIPAAPK
ncbi:MAG: NADP-dependent malic enzyme [Elusimicrobiota bacterium]